MSWFAAATLYAKILLQTLWKEKLSWDDQVLEQLADCWRKWIEGLLALFNHPIPRRFYSNEMEKVSVQLHGFSDASKVGYGAAVYIRIVYKDTSLETRLVTAKMKVTPVKEITIPRLEQCAARLLSQLLQVVANDLSMSIQYVYAWTDSSVVLGWLKCVPTKL